MFNSPKKNEILCYYETLSSTFIQQTRRVNIYSTACIILLGVVGNSLGFLVFLQKKTRTKSTSIYLLCLIISDSMYLVTHFFEDTLKAYIDHFVHKIEYIHEECSQFHSKNESNASNVHQINADNAFNENMSGLINLMGRYDFFCKFINFARYFLRFMSAYIVVAFTIKRTQAIKDPFTENGHVGGRQVLLTILLIVVLASLSSIWIPILLQTSTISYNLTECYIREGYNDLYFVITNCYIVSTMLVPMLIICVCNSISIVMLRRSNRKRQALAVSNDASRLTLIAKKDSVILKSLKLKTILNSIEFRYNHSVNSSCRFRSQETKTNVMLFLMSFSYVILELPYFISWVSLFYHESYVYIDEEDLNALLEYSIHKNFLIGVINLTEILYLLNYSIHFYIYCISSKTFCTRLKRIFKF